MLDPCCYRWLHQYDSKCMFECASWLPPSKPLPIPLLPTLGTTKTPWYGRSSVICFIFVIDHFVSIRNKTLGAWTLTMWERAITAQRFPSPWQFQLMIFIVISEADPQPPPLTYLKLCYRPNSEAISSLPSPPILISQWSGHCVDVFAPWFSFTRRVQLHAYCCLSFYFFPSTTLNLVTCIPISPIFLNCHFNMFMRWGQFW